MAKINKDEYFILKGLDNRWSWIAKDKHYDNLCVYSLEPTKEENEWIRLDSDYDVLNNEYFRFVQWTDKKPYNIDELIAEYENEYAKSLKQLKVAERAMDIKSRYEGLDDDDAEYLLRCLKDANEIINSLLF